MPRRNKVGTGTAWGLALLGIALAVCSGCTNFYRTSWQQPDRVVESLKIAPGAQVADLGAGSGYFLPYLAEAVGPEGKVFAVDVDPEVVQELRDTVAAAGYTNVEVVLGEFDDPLLPDGAIDLVFLCNTYHHIEDRARYFSRLQIDLKPGGRVAILDPNADLGGFVSLFLNDGHTSAAADVVAEMQTAGYRSVQSFDFLLTQIFELFATGVDAD